MVNLFWKQAIRLSYCMIKNPNYFSISYVGVDAKYKVQNLTKTY